MPRIQFANHFRTLERQGLALERLAREMAKYQPRLTRAQLRRKEVTRRRVYRLNRERPRATLDRMVEHMFDPSVQWHVRFGQRVQDAWVIIVFLAAAVVAIFVLRRLTEREKPASQDVATL